MCNTRMAAGAAIGAFLLDIKHDDVVAVGNGIVTGRFDVTVAIMQPVGDIGSAVDATHVVVALPAAVQSDMRTRGWAPFSTARGT